MRRQLVFWVAFVLFNDLRARLRRLCLCRLPGDSCFRLAGSGRFVAPAGRPVSSLLAAPVGMFISPGSHTVMSLAVTAA
jgi:hypothetical protein